MHAIRPHDYVSLDDAAALERNDRAFASCLDSDAACVQFNAVWRKCPDGVDECLVQIGAVHGQVWSSVAASRYRAQVKQLPALSGTPEADFLAGRLRTDRGKRVVQTKQAENTGGIRAKLNASTDFTKCAGLLKYSNVKSGAQHRQRRYQAANARTND
jgi:hypothetical protein